MQSFIFKSFLPIGALGLFLQASAAWFFPTSQMGTQFLNTAGHLFMTEFIFMHSAVFFGMRFQFADSKFKYWSYTLFMTVIYAWAILEPAEQNPTLWINYGLLTMGRIFSLDARNPYPWIRRQFGVSEKEMLKALWVPALLIAGFYILLIPAIMFLIPTPDFALSEQLIEQIVTVPHRARDLILTVKALWLMYFIQTMISLIQETTLIKITFQNKLNNDISNKLK